MFRQSCHRQAPGATPGRHNCGAEKGRTADEEKRHPDKNKTWVEKHIKSIPRVAADQVRKKDDALVVHDVWDPCFSEKDDALVVHDVWVRSRQDDTTTTGAKGADKDKTEVEQSSLINLY